MISVDKLDPKKVTYLDIVSPDVRANFQAHLLDWGNREPFYILHDGVVQVMVGRHKDLNEVAGDEARFTVEQPIRPGNEKFKAFMDLELLISIDGERHNRLRRLLGVPFSPRNVKDLDDDIREEVNKLLDAIEAKGTGKFDAMWDLAELLMPRVLLDRMLQIPVEKQHVLLRMSDALELTQNIKPGGGFPEEYINAMQATRELIDEVLVERRANPGTDFISQLIMARDEGDKLNDKELFEAVFLFLVAALSSTAAALGGILLTLGRHPDQLAEVTRDPSLVPQTIEECMRWHGSGYIAFPRYAREDTVVGGTLIPAGAPILMCFGGANFDASMFTDPARFDIHREPRNITAFGAKGPHHCMGNKLARAVLQHTLTGLVERFPRLRLAEPDFSPTYRGHVSEVHCEELMMRYD